MMREDDDELEVSFPPERPSNDRSASPPRWVSECEIEEPEISRGFQHLEVDSPRSRPALSLSTLVVPNRHMQLTQVMSTLELPAFIQGALSLVRVSEHFTGWIFSITRNCRQAANVLMAVWGTDLFFSRTRIAI
ncbi:hypothetical protein CLOM_g9921 [Closterium sp. NIES-68]|nr:hypothetical protein CLOM_g9921 [Closterium sp. NIES-68]GJP64282.1 hypothetical protein CLOP_g21295 [Closterium sp. NIES-67]